MQEQLINLKYKLSWPFQYLRAPTNFAQIQEHSIPKYLNCRSGGYEETVKITFLGDLMGLGNKELILDDSVLMDIENSDYLVINLESVLVDESDLILDKQYTHQSTFRKLMGQLNSSRVLFGMANNHVYDYGIEGIRQTTAIIESCGAKYFGLKEKPSLIIKNGLEICASTLWHRKEDHFVNKLSDLKSAKNDVIHFLHWGKEFQMLPTLGQKKLIDDLKDDSLCVIGHHSHTPQPINFFDKQLVAYSLGNMATGHSSDKINSGLITTITFGRNTKWNVIEVNWDFVTQDISSSQCLLRRDG